MAAPDIMLAYQAMESIFSAVFDKTEPLLNARWVTLRNDHGLPYHVGPTTIEVVAKWADAELAALALHGGTGLNTGLPLTDHQQARHHQLKETEKKRAHAAKVTLDAAAVKSVADAQAKLVKESPPPQPKVAAIDGAKPVNYTSTTSVWASACRDWTTGVCTKGINCLFAHAGVPTNAGRCLTCGRMNHLSKECTAPGGGADPKKQEVWTAYTQRKDKYYPAYKEAKAKEKAGGKGKSTGKGKGDGKGKSAGKGKGKGKGKPNQAKAAFDLLAARGQ